LIFGIWRNRRQEQDDELLSAYIDRRLGGEPEVELPERLRADVAGLAETAALLRSVERVPAPRSFALTPEMVQLPDSPSFSERTGWSLALFRAPAIAAAAAAFALGLLVIGNIAGVLEQDSPRKSSDASLAAPLAPADSTSAGMAAPAPAGAAEAADQDDVAAAGDTGDAAVPAAAAPEAPPAPFTADAPVESAASAASSVPPPGEDVPPLAAGGQAVEPAAVPEDPAMLDPAEGSDEAPADAGSPDVSSSSAAPEAQPEGLDAAANDTAVSEQDGPLAAGAADGPSMAAGAPEAELRAAESNVDADADDSAAADPADRMEAGLSGGTDADRLPEGLEKGLESLETEPADLPARSGGGLPSASDAALPADGESPGLDFGIAEVSDDDGLSLPLWQLEVAFGLLALVLGGIAFAMKRR